MKQQCPSVFAILVTITAASLGIMLGMLYTQDAIGVQQAPQQPTQQTSTGAQGLAGLPKVWPLAPHEAPSWFFKGVQHVRAKHQGDARLIPLCNDSFVDKHPLAAADYERSFTPGSVCSMPPGLLHKIQSGAPVRIVAVGGSMTQGRECIDGKRAWQTCAWPSRMHDRLNEIFSGSNITVKNAALPGFSYSNWLASGMLDSLTEADVVIVDQQVNSQVGAGFLQWLYKVDLSLAARAFECMYGRQ